MRREGHELAVQARVRCSGTSTASSTIWVGHRWSVEGKPPGRRDANWAARGELVNMEVRTAVAITLSAIPANG